MGRPGAVTDPMAFIRTTIRLVAQGFGTGLSPHAPGTAGTLAGLLIYLPMRQAGEWIYIAFVVVAFVVGIFLCGRAADLLGEHDHPSIVWDEMVGFWTVMILAPHAWYWIAVGFLLFRLFDIAKPWPISWLDRHVKGGFGIMVDDLAAAAASWILLQMCHVALRYTGVVA